MKKERTGIEYKNIPYLGDVKIMQCVEKYGPLAGKYYADASEKGILSETISKIQENTEKIMLSHSRHLAKQRQAEISGELENITKFLEESSTREGYLESHKIHTHNTVGGNK